MGRRVAAIVLLTLLLLANLRGIAVRSQTGRAEAAKGGAGLASRAVDLTYPFNEKTIYWPTDLSFRWQKTKWGPSEGDGHWYASATYSASEHGGTHIDSPIHFDKDGPTVDQIPLSKLIGPAAVVDVRDACAKDRDYRLRVDDLEGWERTHGRIPDGAIVLVHTGWGQYWPDKARYMGSVAPGDTANLHFPGISREAAEWLVSRRKISGIGIDTASLDHGPSRDFIAHRVLNGAGVYGLENVASLEKVPAAGATVIAMPMKIQGGSGGPTRILAILP